MLNALLQPQGAATNPLRVCVCHISLSACPPTSRTQQTDSGQPCHPYLSGNTATPTLMPNCSGDTRRQELMSKRYPPATSAAHAHMAARAIWHPGLQAFKQQKRLMCPAISSSALLCHGMESTNASSQCTNHQCIFKMPQKQPHT